MQTKVIRIEQKDFNQPEIDQKINSVIQELETNGKKVEDVRIAVGRDAWESSGIDIKYSITVLIMYS